MDFVVFVVVDDVVCFCSMGVVVFAVLDGVCDGGNGDGDGDDNDDACFGHVVDDGEDVCDGDVDFDMYHDDDNGGNADDGYWKVLSLGLQACTGM